MKLKTFIQSCLAIMFFITGLIVILSMDIGVKNIVKDKVGEVFKQLTYQNGEIIEQRLYRYQKVINSVVIDKFIVTSIEEYERLSPIDRVDTVISLNRSIRPVLVVEDGIRTVGYWLESGFTQVFGEENIDAGQQEMMYQAFFKNFYKDYKSKEITSTYHATWNYSLFNQYKRLILTQEITDYNTNKVIGAIFMVIDTDTLFQNILPDKAENESYILLNKENEILLHPSKKEIGKKYNMDGELCNHETIIDEEGGIVATYKMENGYTLIGRFSPSVINADVMRLRAYMLLIIGLCLVLVLIISYLAGKYIDARFDYLKVLIGRLEKGDFSMAVKNIPSPSNEFDDIYNHFYSMASEVERLIRENYISEIDKQEAELTALQYQINPHFLFNTLEIISSLARINEQEDIELISQKLGQLFRYNMNRDELTIITLEDEVRHVENYIFIQSIHHNNNIDYYWDIAPEHMNNIAMRFLLQPIIENSIKHGFKNRKGGSIEVLSYQHEGLLIIEISDDGVGMSEEEIRILNKNIQVIEKRKHENMIGLGMRNVNRRMKLLFGEEYGLEVKHETMGLSIVIRLPFSSQDIGEDEI